MLVKCDFSEFTFLEDLFMEVCTCKLALNSIVRLLAQKQRQICDVFAFIARASTLGGLRRRKIPTVVRYSYVNDFIIVMVLHGRAASFPHGAGWRIGGSMDRSMPMDWVSCANPAGVYHGLG